MIRACPWCGTKTTQEPYDVGSGPELSCSNCEWCWGADGQPLRPVTGPPAPNTFRLYLDYQGDA